MAGGPPRDGIPSIDEPRFVGPGEAAEWLADSEPVIALGVGFAAQFGRGVAVGSFLAGQGLVDSTVQFIGYGLGRGAILIAVTIGAALFWGTVSRWLRTALPYVHRMSALFLTGAGVYLVYYWLFVAGLQASSRQGAT
jgi:hypothetical protein